MSKQAAHSFPKEKIKFTLLEGVHPAAVSLLENRGYTNIDLHNKSLSGEALNEALCETQFLGIRSRTQITEAVLDAAPKLRAIGCFCIGTNQVDLQATAMRGIPVFNAPFANTRSVAELVLGEMILLMRGIPAKNAAAHRQVWQKTAKNAHEVRGKTLGIIGYGHIGTQLGILAENLGMRVIYHDVASKLALGNAAPCESLEACVAESDVVSLHVPDTAETRNLIDSNILEHFKQGSYLINASRGKVVDIDALCEKLESKHLLGAAIDVFPEEPKSNDEAFISPLTKYDNVILTPHIGGSTLEAQENIAVDVAEKLITYSDNGSTVLSVNFPEVSLPSQRNTHRILHIHANKPGIMTTINRVLSEQTVNISAQYLQTRDDIGYVVIDVDAINSLDAFKALKTVDGTIQSRILY